MSTDTQSFVFLYGTEYEVVKKSNVISADSKKGTKYWQAYVIKDCGKPEYFTTTCSWHTTKDGLSKQVWSTPYYAEPTNVGQSNHRDNQAQALFELDSMVNKQTDKRLSERPLPMLAQTFSKRKKYIDFANAAIQPKLDGNRMLYNGEEAWSRGNKDVIAECVEHLAFETNGYIIDGELILPGNPKVNVTASAAKKFKKGVSDTLMYMVYDIAEPDMTFEERYALLKRLLKDSPNKNVILVETHTVHNEDEIMKWHADFTERGFEGSIIRNNRGKYAINQRSNDLQKHKDFVDAEFEIVDIIPAGGGSSANVGKFVCVDEKGGQFESTATGTEAERTEYLVNKQKYIGRWAKIKYRELSGKNQVPFHSNVLEIRDTKDQGF